MTTTAKFRISLANFCIKYVMVNDNSKYLVTTDGFQFAEISEIYPLFAIQSTLLIASELEISDIIKSSLAWVSVCL